METHSLNELSNLKKPSCEDATSCRFTKRLKAEFEITKDDSRPWSERDWIPTHAHANQSPHN